MSNESGFMLSAANNSYKINNSTSKDLGEEDEHIAIIQASVLSLLFLIAATGNGALISLYARDYRMHTNTNRLVMSHIAAEFAASVVGILMYVSILAHGGKQHSEFYGQSFCIFLGCVNVFFFCGSFLSLTSICIDRYMAVVKGVQHHITLIRVQIALGVVWTLSFISSIPWDLAVNKLPQRYLAWLLSNCRYEYPNSAQLISLEIYQSILTVLTLYMPAIIILYTCFHILRAAIRSRNQVHVIRTFSHRIATAYSRSAFTTVLIITVYFLCIAPSAVLYIFIKQNAHPFPQANYIIAKVALSFRSACYPVIYAVRNEKFFRYVCKLLTRTPKFPCVQGCVATPQLCPDNKWQLQTISKQKTAKVIGPTGTQTQSEKDQFPKMQSSSRRLAFVDIQQLPAN